MNNYVPKRGDIIWMSFDPALGHEQKGRRPAIVLSNERYKNITGLAFVCPITNKQKNLVSEIPLPKEMKIKGFILTNHFKGIDWTKRSISFSGEVISNKIMYNILERVEVICSP